MSKVSQKRQSRSNEAFFLYGYNTVQTSWRPQVPLPKEVNISGTRSHSTTNLNNERYSDMDKNSNKSTSSLNTSITKKWSLGRLFRKKQKDNETDSSSDEQDRKAGFSPSQKPRKKDKRKRSSKIIGAGFDHIVMGPRNENEFFVPFEQIELPTPPAEQFRSTNSLEENNTKKDHRRKAITGRSHTAQIGVPINYYPSHQQQQTQQQQQPQPLLKQMCLNSSSEEEMISATQSYKYRSDDSLGTGSGGVLIDNSNGNGNNGNGVSRKSRAARTERYYKRMSRDGEMSNGGILPHTAQKIQQHISPVLPHSQYAYEEKPNRERHKVLLHPEPPRTFDQQPNNQMREASSLNYVAFPASLHLRNQNIAPGYKAAPLPQHYTSNQKFNQIPQKNLQNSMTNDKRSISYDSQIHVPNRNLNLHRETRKIPQQEPPVPPPRDPQRRVHLNSSHNELRPLSFSFDQNPSNSMNKINGRCVSDDKLWGQNKSLYQNMQRPSSTQPPSQSVIYSCIGPKQPNQGPYVTKSVVHSRTPPPPSKPQPKPSDFRYITDAAPRSRKPIHILNQNLNTVPSASETTNLDHKLIESPIRTSKNGLLPSKPETIKSASNFWKQIDREEQNRQGLQYEAQRGIRTAKPRSMSSSRVNEMQTFRNEAFEDILNGNKSQVDGLIPTTRENSQKSRFEQFSRKRTPAQLSCDEVDNVISGSLLLKPTQDKAKNLIEISSQSHVKVQDKSRSMPNYYQNRTSYVNENPINFVEMPKPNKYDEYVARLREQNRIQSLRNERNRDERNSGVPPQAISRTNIQQDNDSSNIEDVINELEAIYKSLNFVGRKPKNRTNEVVEIPKTKEFDLYAREFKDDSSSEESAEPDVIRDDLALRNMKFSNDLVKTIDNQPPFGIPIGPIPPSPNTDYLHAKPEKDMNRARYSVHNPFPDVITDDLAVRTLRKDSPNRATKPKYEYMNDASKKKQRATRTQSANIYALIQRDAAKPSGGDLADYYDWQKSLEKTGSLNDVSKHSDEPPITLQLLKNLRNQEQQYQSGSLIAKRPVFRHPSQGGAICSLPIVLKGTQEKLKAPVPLPRSSISPDPIRNRSGMEEALNQIAKDAKESSEKLSRDLLELRKEALLSSTTNKNFNSSENKLIEIDAASNELKRCEEILLDVVPSEKKEEPQNDLIVQPRKLEKEEKYLSDIETVSMKAKKVQNIILVDIEKSRSASDDAENIPEPIKELENESMKDLKGKSTVSSLLKNLDSSPDKIDSITERCIRQINKLGKNNNTNDNIIDIPLIKNKSIKTTFQTDAKQSDEDNSGADYDNLNENLKQMTIAASQITICKEQQNMKDLNKITTENILVPESNTENNKIEIDTNEPVVEHNQINKTSKLNAHESTGDEEEIDKIMKECELNTKITKIIDNNDSNASFSNKNLINASNENSLDNQNQKFINTIQNKSLSTDNESSPQRCYASDDTVTTCSAGNTDGGIDQVEAIFITQTYSSSDCIKSSSPGSVNTRNMSSSLTSAHNGGFSSSDYVKSPSSEYFNHHSSTSDPIKTFSTTSYDCSTSSATPNLINLSSPLCSSEYDNTTNNNSQIFLTPSPPLNLTPIGNEVHLKSSSSKSMNKSNSIDSLISNTNQSSQYNSSEELAAIFGISSSPTTIESQPGSIKAPIAKTEVCNELLYNDEYYGQGNKIISQNAMKSNARNNIFAAKNSNQMNGPKMLSNIKCFKCKCINNSQNSMCDSNSNSFNLNSNSMIETNYKNNVLKSILKNGPSRMKDDSSALCLNCLNQDTKHSTLNHKVDSNNECSISNTNLVINKTQSILNVIPESQNESSSPSNSIDSLSNTTTDSQPDYTSFSPKSNTYSSNVHILISDKDNTKNSLTQFDSLSSTDEDNSSNPDSGNVSLSDFPVQQLINNNSSSLEVELDHNSKFNVSSNFVNELKIEFDESNLNQMNSKSNDNIDIVDTISNSNDIKTNSNEISYAEWSQDFDNDDSILNSSTSSTPDSFKSFDNTSYLCEELNFDSVTPYRFDHDILSIQVPLLRQSNQILKFLKPSEYDDDDFYTDDNQLSSIEEEDENISECDDGNLIESEHDDLELKQFEILENHFRTSINNENLPIDLNDEKSDTSDLINKIDSNSNDRKLINERISLPSTSTSTNSYDMLTQNHSNSNLMHRHIRNDHQYSNDRTDEISFSDKLQLAHPDAARTTILEHMIIICTYGLASNDVFTFFAIIVAVITLIAFLML